MSEARPDGSTCIDPSNSRPLEYEELEKGAPASEAQNENPSNEYVSSQFAHLRILIQQFTINDFGDAKDFYMTQFNGGEQVIYIQDRIAFHIGINLFDSKLFMSEGQPQATHKSKFEIVQECAGYIYGVLDDLIEIKDKAVAEADLVKICEFAYELASTLRGGGEYWYRWQSTFAKDCSRTHFIPPVKRKAE